MHAGFAGIRLYFQLGKWDKREAIKDIVDYIIIDCKNEHKAILYNINTHSYT